MFDINVNKHIIQVYINAYIFKYYPLLFQVKFLVLTNRIVVNYTILKVLLVYNNTIYNTYLLILND